MTDQPQRPGEVASSPGDVLSIPPARERLVFPEIARLELDDLLTQLIDRAGDVLRTQGRLRALLAATQAISADTGVSVVLRKIVDAACGLVDAQYAALGVVGSDGHLSQFIHVGMSSEEVARIGALPVGRGVLGLLIDAPQPLRLDDIASHAQSVGFPPGHPPMHTFLGVPIRVGSRVFGHIYATEKRNGQQFTADDEELLGVLAGTAAVTIEHAQLYEQAQGRQRTMAVAAEMTQAIVSAGALPHTALADEVLELTAANRVLVLTAPAEGTKVRVVAAAGDGAANVRGLALALRGEDIAGLAGGDSADAPASLLAALAPYGIEAGPVLVVPIEDEQRCHAVIVALRAPTADRYDAHTEEKVRLLADRCAVALTIAGVQQDAAQLELLRERDRIARDINDAVVSRLFAAGLALNGLAGRIGDPEIQAMLVEQVGGLDEVITLIRNSIFRTGNTDGT